MRAFFKNCRARFQQAVHRLGAEAHFLADLLVGEPGEALQDQGPALVFGQGVQELLQPAAQFLLLQVLEGRGPGIGRAGSTLLVQGFLGVPPPQEVQAVVGGDAVEPGAHRRLGLEAVGVLVDLEKDLL